MKNKLVVVVHCTCTGLYYTRIACGGIQCTLYVKHDWVHPDVVRGTMNETTVYALEGEIMGVCDGWRMSDRAC